MNLIKYKLNFINCYTQGMKFFQPYIKCLDGASKEDIKRGKKEKKRRLVDEMPHLGKKKSN